MGIDRFTTDLVTAGGPVNVDIRNMGWGRHVSAQPVSMSYRNPRNFSYVAQNCHVQWNGSTVSCIAPPGVGKGHRWTLILNGFDGFESPPSIVTNYKPPVLYDIFSGINVTKTSASTGGDVFNLTGNNFGPLTDNAVSWVRYSPLSDPETVFNANCTLIVDHYVLQCYTEPQAGGELRWLISVGDQESQVPSTSTEVPVIESVQLLWPGDGLVMVDGRLIGGAVALRSAGHFVSPTAARQLHAAGGGIVLLRGRCVACVACVAARITAMPCPALAVAGPAFVALSLAVAAPLAIVATAIAVPVCSPISAALSLACCGVCCDVVAGGSHSGCLWLCSNFAEGRGDIPMRVLFTPTRSRPPRYHTNTSGDSTGPNHDAGPRSTYPDVFECPQCVTTVKHSEITCVVPPGYGGQLQWTVEVLSRFSPPFRCVATCLSASVRRCACLCVCLSVCLSVCLCVLCVSEPCVSVDGMQRVVVGVD